MLDLKMPLLQNNNRVLILCLYLVLEPGISTDECDTAWDQMVFSFELAGASLTLYSNERPLVSALIKSVGVRVRARAYTCVYVHID